ncbi:hypothetical protein FJZ33_00420 [Candidatus Poribacteria bacterium]|nr:hypothetical protein [Candidatus Poribacteria bacterium]
MQEIILQIKKDLSNNKLAGLALDIDETLSWTIGYWVERMQKLFGNPENLSVDELIKKYRYTQNVPYWKTKEALEWMKIHQESSEFQENLPPIKNANNIVQKINQIIPITLYITTRPEGVIKETKNWLQKHHFPDAEIIARPRNIPYKHGNQWKAMVLEMLYPKIIGIIDDNPGLADALSEEYKGMVYLYDNIFYQRRHVVVIPCKTWTDVLKAVEKTTC